MSKTLGLALGAGGTRGIAHVGFLKALEEADIRPDYIAGSSMGSVVGACYSKGMTCDEMRDIAFELKTTDILDVSLIALAKLGLLKSVRVRKLISGFLEDCTFEQLHIPFCCVAVDLKTAELKCFSGRQRRGRGSRVQRHAFGLPSRGDRRYASRRRRRFVPSSRERSQKDGRRRGRRRGRSGES